MNSKISKLLLLILAIIFIKISVYGQVINPFEIKRKNDTFNISKYSPEYRIDPNGISDKTEITRVANPFEVSHIPIRRVFSKASSTNDKIKTETDLFDKIRFFYLLTTWILLLIVIMLKKSTLTRIFRSLSNQNFLKLTMREDNNGMQANYYLLYLIFLINFSLFLYYSNNYFWNYTFFDSYLNCLLTTLILLALKHFVIYIFSILFGPKREMLMYNFLIYLFCIIIGFFLLPVLPVYLYADAPFPQLIYYLVGGLLAVIVVYLYLKVFLTTINTITNSIFLFFIYLCALEILPIMLLIKFWYNILGR